MNMQGMKLLAMLSILALSGCSFSGLGGSSSFHCSAPIGVSCDSISGNYANAVAGTLNVNTQQAAKDTKSKVHGYFTDSNIASISEIKRITPTSGMPIRSQSKVLRIWIAPYQDTDGDLIDASYLYVTLNEGRWLIEHNQQRLIQEYRPVNLVQGAKNNAASPVQTQKSGMSLGIMSPTTGVSK